MRPCIVGLGAAVLRSRGGGVDTAALQQLPPLARCGARVGMVVAVVGVVGGVQGGGGGL